MSQEKFEKTRESNTNWPIDTLKTSCSLLGKQECIQGLRENDHQTYYRQGPVVLGKSDEGQGIIQELLLFGRIVFRLLFILELTFTENLTKIKELLNNIKISHHVRRKLHEWRVVEKHLLILLVINNDLEAERQRKISTSIGNVGNSILQ